MSEDKGYVEQEEIYSQTMRAGRRTYFFDVRETKAGDYYLTITESKKFSNDDGSFHFKKHKIYLYKEDFAEFKASLNRATDFVIKEKGDEVISERHQKDYVKPSKENEASDSIDDAAPENFTDVNFDDI
jgi:hypothetical protein